MRRSRSSVIIVEFRPSGRNATEVVLTYTHLERHGEEMAPLLRSAIETSSPDDTLHKYAQTVARHAAPERGVDA
jgi:hypothetical protein